MDDQSTNVLSLLIRKALNWESICLAWTLIRICKVPDLLSNWGALRFLASIETFESDMETLDPTLRLHNICSGTVTATEH